MRNQLVTGVLAAVFALGSLCSLSVVAKTQAVLSIQGELTQGALLIGQTQPGAKVTLNDEPLELTETGAFVFGFGRDAALEHKLKVTLENGDVHSKSLTLAAREYKVERVDGVPPSTVNPDPEQVARSQKEAEKVWLARNGFSDRTDFLQPVIQPAEGRISGVYGSQRIFNGEPRRPHFGLDIAAPTGTPVIAPWTGRVLLAVPDMFFSGGTLIIDHGFGITTTYIHLHRIHAHVGDTVVQGETIAEIGATGRVTGPHLDWRVNWQHERLDPALLPTLYQPD